MNPIQAMQQRTKAQRRTLPEDPVRLLEDARQDPAGHASRLWELVRYAYVRLEPHPEAAMKGIIEMPLDHDALEPVQDQMVVAVAGLLVDPPAAPAPAHSTPQLSPEELLDLASRPGAPSRRLLELLRLSSLRIHTYGGTGLPDVIDAGLDALGDARAGVEAAVLDVLRAAAMDSMTRLLVERRPG